MTEREPRRESIVNRIVQNLRKMTSRRGYLSEGLSKTLTKFESRS